MAGSLLLAGAQPQKQPRYAPLYTSRFWTGLVTNRSPLRSAGSAYEERYLGTRGDALIDGSNCEITPRLTLARRPGNPVYNSQTFNAVDFFYSFREFNSTTEQIRVMVDEAAALYDGTANSRTLVFTKSAGAGQSYMQSVGNILFFANGVDQKKWVQSLNTWSAGHAWGTIPDVLPPIFIDPNGNIQELTSTIIPIDTVQIATNVLTVVRLGFINLTTVLTAGLEVTFPSGMAASFLNGQTVTILTVTSGGFTAAFTNANYGPTAETNKTAFVVAGGSPISGTVQPTWSTTVPSSGNNFQGGTTDDGTARWTNHGGPIENWGLAAPTDAPTVVVGNSSSAWHKNTFYSLAGVVVDSNGNLQQVTTAGLAGSTQPVWNTAVGGTTTDNTVTWTMIQTAASLVWQAGVQYQSSPITSYSITTNVVTVIQNNNFFVGQTIVPSGLTTGTYLNGQFLKIATRNSTQFTAAFVHGNVGATAEAAAIGTPSPYLVNNASGTNCLFKIGTNPQPTLPSSLTAKIWIVGTGPQGGQFIQTFPTAAPDATTTGNSTNFNTFVTTSDPVLWAVKDGSGAITSETAMPAAAGARFNMAIYGTMHIPVAGQYVFEIKHQNGFLWGFGNSGGNFPVKVSGLDDNPVGQTTTAVNNYPLTGSNNQRNGTGPADPVFDNYVINFPIAGDYPFEVDWAGYGTAAPDFRTLIISANGEGIVPEPSASGSVQPIWPSWVTGFAPNYPTVKESSGQYVWNNLGPIVDATWQADINFTLPNTRITDPNNNAEDPYRAGVSGTNPPTFATGINQLTNDNPNLIWINKGPASAPAPGTVSAFNGGYQYVIALVNTATNTVSNASKFSVATGNFIGASGIAISGGLPPLATIDPQADYVAIFRTTDGQTVPFLIPGTGNSLYTISLADYITSGYTDTAQDTDLNNLISAPVAGENTPPGVGAKNLTYHLSRIFFSIGNTVYWTSGPDTPVGNGMEGVAPANNQVFPSLVTRIVPTTIGALTFTISDIYLIPGQGTPENPISPAYPYAKGIGLLNYNALDIFGSSIGFFASDKTFNVLDFSSGPSEVGFSIGDKLQGSSWNAANVYVTWHSAGEDKAWFVSDGSTGWYRVSVTPSPEQGVTWSPFATIVGGAKAVQSIEVTPGVHKLLIGPTTSGNILNRDISSWLDGNSAYTWFGIVGSHVLANPGQLAEVAFLATDCVATGTKPSISVLLNEAFPYFIGPFEQINFAVPDPPTLPESKSIYGQRFYLSETLQPAVCRSMQWRIDFPAENAQNELIAATIFGAVLVE